MSREERKSGWKLFFLSIKSVRMLIYFLKSSGEINPSDIYNTHTLTGLKYHWSCDYEGEWREMIGMGRKKKFSLHTTHSPPQGHQSGVQRPLLSLLFFFKCSSSEGKAWLCVSWTGSRPQASSESPRKTKNCLVLWSNYFFLTLEISKIWTFAFFNYPVCL